MYKLILMIFNYYITKILIKLLKYLCNKCILFSCRHGDNGCCVHCSPLEPYDEEYLKTQNMKHLSFHSYLRKMTAGMEKYVV